MSFERRVERICHQGLDARTLRIALLDEIRTVVPYDAYAWLLTDPQTCVGSAPVATIPVIGDLPRLIRLKYLTLPNRWTDLVSNTPTTLQVATSGDRSASRLWDELLVSYGVDDVMSIVFRDGFGCWGFVDMWRMGGVFSTAECAALQQVASVITAALRQSLAQTFEQRAGVVDQPSGPAVLLLSDDIELLTQTPQTDVYLRQLLPPQAGRSPVPAAAYNVAAQLLAREAGIDSHPPSARVHVRDNLWVTLRAARIDGGSAGDGASIAVSIEPTPPIERAGLYGTVAGLTPREAELLLALVDGSDTRQLAGRLFLSEHTVQDHLKAIFAKTGVNNRRVLVARATGVA